MVAQLKLRTTHCSVIVFKQCVAFYFICLLTHCMYIIHSKAKFIVIEIIKPITRNAKISNIKPHPLTLDKKSRSRATTHLLILLSMPNILHYFLLKVYIFSKILHLILLSSIYKVRYLLEIYLQKVLTNFLSLIIRVLPLHLL